MELPQVKSKQRVADHGEVYTNPREVNAMLDLVKEQSFSLSATFLEPACGNGNFLIEILPYSPDRDGITLGEATAAAYLTRDPQGAKAQLLGSASINDAAHISAPSRTGEGLYQSVQRALQEAQLHPEQIELINAHGTGTRYNDEMESHAFSRAQLLEVPLNSYKGYFGHTLGTAGLLETIVTIEAARRGVVLKSLNSSDNGVPHPLDLLKEHQHQQLTYFLKTASGFGGSNTAVVIAVVR